MNDDRITSSINRVAPSVSKVGWNDPTALRTKEGFVYRETGEPQIKDIIECGYVRSNSKRKSNQVWWTSGGENSFHVNKKPVLVASTDIVQDFHLHELEHDILSTHSLLSISTLLLNKNKYYKKSDLVHFHQIHNSRFCLPTLFEMAKTKPTVISFHDPWFMTGRCVHALDCDKWKNGCNNCANLNTFFDLPYDNCSELWKIKSQLANTDVDIIVH